MAARNDAEPLTSGVGPVVSSAHLARSSLPALSEVEFALTMANNAFQRWMVRCMTAAGLPGSTSVTTRPRPSSPRAIDVNQLREAEEQLWREVPGIPLAAQPRWFVMDRTVGNVVTYKGLAGIGWNMDRWLSEDNGA